MTRMAGMDSGDAFTVRALTARDLPFFNTVLADWTPAQWEAGTEASAHRWLALVRYVDGVEVPAGIAEYQQIVDEGHLLGIAVVPELHGCGLGMRLLQAALDDMRANGCTRCLLEVRRSNAAARTLYERAGFLFDGLRKDYYPPQDSMPREDALLYSRAL